MAVIEMSVEYHVPVMLREVMEYLRPDRGGLYFDGTVGGGGHAEAMLSADPAVRVIAVDQDREALEVAGNRLKEFGDRVRLVRANYADAAAAVAEPLAGALLDLGVSSHQIDDPGRGFSFRPGTPLDMRMGGGTGTPKSRTAADLLNSMTESELADVFFHYGEERRARRLAAEVVKARRLSPFRVSDDLLAVLARVLGPRIEAQDKARIFQALRIAVNDELSVLERAMPVLRDRLAPSGVFVVLSYHSLEDRRVKDAFREWSRDCVCPPEFPVCRCRGVALGELLTRKAVQASADEVARNARARSVRLRAWRRAA
jgi:16S rRNA (cytosine1402-N4)-methyltransferase